MDLRSLVDTFGQDVTIKTVTAGSYVNGIWVEGTSTTSTIFGVLFHLSFEDVQRLTGGQYTTQDKKLIIKEDLVVNIGDIIVDGDEYEIEKELDQGYHGKLKSYVAAKVVD